MNLLIIGFCFFLIPSLFLLRPHTGSNHPLSPKLAGKQLDLEKILGEVTQIQKDTHCAACSLSPVVPTPIFRCECTTWSVTETSIKGPWGGGGA